MPHGRETCRLVRVAALVAFLLSGAARVDQAPFGGPRSETRTRTGAWIVENQGQFDRRARFVAWSGGAIISFLEDAIVLDFPATHHAVYILLGSHGDGRPETSEAGSERLDTQLHFFLGNDPARHRTGIHPCTEILYRGVAAGRDLRCRLLGSSLQYRIDGEQSAPSATELFIFQGATRIETLLDGSSRVDLPCGSLLDAPDLEDPGCRSLRWNLDSPGSDPDTGGEADPQELVGLLASTFLGGGDNDYAHGVAIDAAGRPVVIGYTRSYNFPSTPGSYDGHQAGVYDFFVAKLDPSASTLIWCTYVGGAEEDRPFAVDLDPYDRPVVAGYSRSTDFPTTPLAHDRTLAGPSDGVVLSLDATGSALRWSTFLGGTGYDRAWDMLLDSADRPVVSGVTGASDFPTRSPAFDETFNGALDGFVAMLDPLGRTLVSSTFVGGVYADQITHLMLDAGERRILTGDTKSPDLPTTPDAFDRTHNGEEDAFVLWLSADSDSLLYGSYLGGAADDWGNVVDLADNGDAIVIGSTGSADFPTTETGCDRTWNGEHDMFVSRVRPGSDGLRSSTYLGGPGPDEAHALVIDRDGCAVVSGTTGSSSFPTTTDAFDRVYGGGIDACLVRLDPYGSRLLYSSFLGGSDSDGGWEMEIDPGGAIVLVGPTRSADFPTTPGAFDRTQNGNNDAYLLRFSLPPVPAALPEPVEEESADHLAPASRLRLFPNPFTREVWMEIDTAPAEARALRFVVLDASGRRIVGPCPFPSSAEGGRVLWDGRDDAGRSVPSGIYWIHVTDGGPDGSSRRLVRIVP